MGQKIAYSCSDGSLSLGLVVPKMSLQRCFNYLDISDWFSNQISPYPVHPRLYVINSIKENCGGGCGYRIGTLSVVRITGLNENKWCSWCGSVQFCSGHQTQSGFVILLASKWEPFRLWFAIHPSSSESPLDLIQHIIMRVRLHGSTEWMTDWLTDWMTDWWMMMMWWMEVDDGENNQDVDRMKLWRVAHKRGQINSTVHVIITLPFTYYSTFNAVISSLTSRRFQTEWTRRAKSVKWHFRLICKCLSCLTRFTSSAL